MPDILQLALELGAALAASPEFTAQQQAETALALDGEAQELLAQTDDLRAELRHKLESGTPPDQLQEGLARLREANAALAANATLSAVNTARREMTDLVAKVNTLIKFHIGADDGCGGNCSSCGGCG